jgi:predicted ATP-binding protein involved in virulence
MKMNEYFIEHIELKENKQINRVEVLNIPLSKETRKHLIFTGKNGSGKTTTLREINKLFNNLILENMLQVKEIRVTINNHQDIFDFRREAFIVAFFEAKRENTPTVSTAIQNIKLNIHNTTDTKQLHKRLIEYMVKKRTDMLNDKYDGDGKKADIIQKWFENFEDTLKTLFDEPLLILKYYSEELNFKIEYQGKSFGLNQLSDGYSSLLAIVTELILRMEAHNVQVYDMQGIVLIDEIETHLHVDLQKKILPFLIDFFPKIQFIVTTHSPFVLSSISNAVICDLEKNFITEDLSSYSYDALIESYFDSDKYSQEVKDKLNRFEVLSQKDELLGIEQDEYFKFKRYFKSLPTFMADELAVKINEILLNDLGKR